MHVKYVIVHETDGILVGMALGLAFFSLLDSAGQWEVPVITKADFTSIIKSWKEQIDENATTFFDKLSVKEVKVSNPAYATIEELEAAGLGDLLGDMRDNFEKYTKESSDVVWL